MRYLSAAISCWLACFALLAVAGPVETFVREYQDGTLLPHERGLDAWRERTSDRRIEVVPVREDDGRVWAVFNESAKVMGEPRQMRGVVMLQERDGRIVTADWHIFRGNAYCAAAAGGHAADIGSTAVALSRGFAEGNPLGAALIPMKVAVYFGLRSLPLYECMGHMQSFGKAGWAASGWNVGFMVGGPALGAVGLIAGLVVPMSADDAALECAGC